MRWYALRCHLERQNGPGEEVDLVRRRGSCCTGGLAIPSDEAEHLGKTRISPPSDAWSVSIISWSGSCEMWELQARGSECRSLIKFDRVDSSFPKCSPELTQLRYRVVRCFTEPLRRSDILVLRQKKTKRTDLRFGDSRWTALIVRDKRL